MADQSKIEELGIKAFQRRKVLTIMELTSLLGLSDRSIHRRLKKWKALTSYNHNGRYYTLPSTPCFDENGIWHFRDISFSSQGTLKKTVVSIVTSSLQGLSANEIGKMLNMVRQEPNTLSVEDLHFLWGVSPHRVRFSQPPVPSVAWL